MWKIQYGCKEWQEVKEFPTEEEARAEFCRMRDDMPQMGLYPATFALLESPDGETMDSVESDEDGSGLDE